MQVLQTLTQFSSPLQKTIPKVIAFCKDEQQDEVGNNISQGREQKRGGGTPGTAETPPQACTSP